MKGLFCINFQFKIFLELYLQNEDMLEYVYRLHMNEGVILTKTSYYTCIDNEDNEERDVQILIFH